MRVLHVLDHSAPLQSGYAVRTHWILTHQRAAGFETFHLTSPKHVCPFVPTETVDGRRFYRTPREPLFARRIPFLREALIMRRTARRLREVAREVRPDVIHAHSPVLNAVPAVRVGRELGIPVVYEVRAFWEDAAVSHGTCRAGGFRYRMSRWIETQAMRRADVVIAICEGIRGDIVSRGIPDGKVVVIPNAANVVERVEAGPGDPDLATDLRLEGRTVLGFFGSFYRYEGLHLLIRALPLVLRERPNVRLLLAGGGPEEGRLRARIAEMGLTLYVRFAGRVPHSEMEHYYRLADVLVYPREAMRLTELVTPLKALEGLAHGKVVVASDVGGHRELIRDGDTGTLFPPGDHLSLARAVLRALAEPEEWPDRGRRARAYIGRERAWPQVVRGYESVYERLRFA